MVFRQRRIWSFHVAVLRRTAKKCTKNYNTRAEPLYYSSNLLCRDVAIKALVNEDTLLRTHCYPWCFLGCANWETFVADTKCFWTKSETFFVSRTQKLCPQQMLRARANGETFVSATMSPQQCVLVCQGLYHCIRGFLKLPFIFISHPLRSLYKT